MNLKETQKRAFIIHGWDGSPNESWLPWLKSGLENLGLEVEALSMPNPADPKMLSWVNHLSESVKNPDENTYLIGHSLGCITILRYLESLALNIKIGGAILVAGFPESIGYKEIESFFDKPLDYQKVKDSSANFVAINSDNDKYVPMDQAYLLRDKLSADLIVIPGGGHLNSESGYMKLPEALECIKKII